MTMILFLRYLCIVIIQDNKYLIDMEAAAIDRLWTRDYIFVCISAFMMSFSFFILVPTLPLYLKDTFHIGQGLVGIVLSCSMQHIKQVDTKKKLGWMICTP